MGLLNNAVKGTVLTGLAIGIGVVVVLPVLAGAAKPLAKAAMKSGLILYNKGKEVVAGVGEVTEDLWAEAKTEAEAEMKEKVVAEVGEMTEDLWTEAKTEAKAEMKEEGGTTTLDQIEEVKLGDQTS